MVLIFGAVITALVLSAAAAGCSSDKAIAEQQQPTATAVTIAVTQAPTATVPPPGPTPTTVPLPDLSPDEKALSELHYLWRDARVNLEAEHFNDGCDPELAALDTRTPAERLKAWRIALNSGGITPEEWGAGEPSVLVLGGGTTAIVNFAVFRNDEEKFEWANFYTKHDDTWYQDCSF